MVPTLYLVIPCYNEEEVLPETSKLFLAKVKSLVEAGRILDSSRILFVNDGSSDSTWNIIKSLCEEDDHFSGISLSHNRGHQNALIAGLMEASEHCDAAISLDCDGQDDIDAVDKMVVEYSDNGCEIVYGVRSDRKTDTAFKRTTAQTYYKLLRGLGVDIIPDHADYRLMSSRVIKAFAGYTEVNVFLRGIVSQMGFKHAIVYYSRAERIAGKTHYPLGKMIALALDGITSFSVKPLRLIAVVGIVFAVLSLVGVLYSLISFALGETVPGWTSSACIMFFTSGIQMLSLGIIGEYIGKIYLETKRRPRYIIEERINITEEE